MTPHAGHSEIMARAVSGELPLPRPVQATLNVTGRCNSLCKYCAYGNPETMSRADVPFDHLARQIEQIAALGIRSLCLSGGEPMLRPDLCAIIRLALKQGLTVTLITNGTLLSLNSARHLHSAGLYTLVISIDSLRDELYRQVRGIPVGKPRRAFRELQEYRRQTVCIPVIVVNVVLTRTTAEDVLGHVEAVAEWLLPQDRVTVQAYQPPPGLGVDEDPLRFRPSDRRRLEALVEAFIAGQHRGLPLGNDATFLRRLPIFLAEGRLPEDFTCTIGYSSVYIKENLDVHPCWQLPPVGNLNQVRLQEIWSSSAYSSARQRMKALDCRKCVLLCHSPEFLDMLPTLLDRTSGENLRGNPVGELRLVQDVG